MLRKCGFFLLKLVFSEAIVLLFVFLKVLLEGRLESCNLHFDFVTLIL